jgi:hypothetical protein
MRIRQVLVPIRCAPASEQIHTRRLHLLQAIEV